MWTKSYFPLTYYTNSYWESGVSIIPEIVYLDFYNSQNINLSFYNTGNINLYLYNITNTVALSFERTI